MVRRVMVAATHRIRVLDGIRAAGTVLATVLSLVVVVSGESSSGSGCSNGGLDLLPLSPPSASNLSGLILSSQRLCSSGRCVSGWTFCYYNTNGSRSRDINLTVALWRRSEEVEGSRYEEMVKTPPAEQWLVCERRELRGRCVEAEDGDLVRVVIGGVGDVDGEVVMTGDEGVTTQELMGLTLLVSPILGACTDEPSVDEMCRGPATTPSDPPTTPSLSPTTTLPITSPPPSLAGPELWLLVVCGVLGLMVLLLITILCAIVCCRRRSGSKRPTLETVLRNGNRRLYSTGDGDTECDIDLDMHHILKTNTASSTHSTSLSPTPRVTNFTHNLLDTQPVSPWQPSEATPRKKPPPLKPKPLRLSSLKTTPPSKPRLSQEANDVVILTAHSVDSLNHEKSSTDPPNYAVDPPHHAVDPPNHAVDPPHHAVDPPNYAVDPPHHAVDPPHHAVDPPHHAVDPPNHAVDPPHHAVDPPDHAGLGRSYSEEAIHMKWPLKERADILLKLSPRHQSLFLSGSLPDLFINPSVDEDDYAIPLQSSRGHTRPQPYLKPRTIYSYAYTHILSRVSSTVPRPPPPPPVVAAGKTRSLSEKTGDHTHYHTPYNPLNYNDISDETQHRAMAGDTPSKSHTLQPSRTHTNAVSGHAPLRLRSILSSPITSHTPSETGHTPLGCISERLMSTGSEEYVNEDEFPRPLRSLEGPPHLPHYTPLHPAQREVCPDYDLPRPSSDPASPNTGPTSPSPDYDHLKLHLKT